MLLEYLNINIKYYIITKSNNDPTLRTLKFYTVLVIKFSIKYARKQRFINNCARKESV